MPAHMPHHRPLSAAVIKGQLFAATPTQAVVLRQAYRLAPASSDEVVLLHRQAEYWVAARFDDRIVTWPCPDLDTAHDVFERETQHPDWIHATIPSATNHSVA